MKIKKDARCLDIVPATNGLILRDVSLANQMAGTGGILNQHVFTSIDELYDFLVKEYIVD